MNITYKVNACKKGKCAWSYLIPKKERELMRMRVVRYKKKKKRCAGERQSLHVSMHGVVDLVGCRKTTGRNWSG
jgi:hypothetical protein